MRDFEQDRKICVAQNSFVHCKQDEAECWKKEFRQKANSKDNGANSDDKEGNSKDKEKFGPMLRQGMPVDLEASK
ncbi:hypothetical protein [Anaeromusa sp.]|uniref:hypothetical protein n=1 Tax=Anaeromusa sp. TaxID=1872520 RepID=UPI0026182A9E|nr:hypothetical protein [Anaeromusa sp.]MDD3157004.1 hypothetical protein [Anaeromusa sp.]